MTQQTVVITGAASGIGRAAAKRFSAAGWRCVLVDRNAELLERVRNEVMVESVPAGAERRHDIRCLDLTDPVQVRSLASISGSIDAIVNNAGLSDTTGVALTDQSPEQLNRLVALNLDAPAQVVSTLASRLASGARIVNVASGAGFHAIPYRGLYSPTKAGLIAQTRALARVHPEWVVTVLCPGFVRTELVDGLIAAGRLDAQQATAKIPLGRMAEPAEMADALFFLSSPGAAAIHAQVLAVDGGSSIHGGSGGFLPLAGPRPPRDAPVTMTMIGNVARWGELSSGPDSGHGYPATIDASAIDDATAAACGRFDAICAGARRFAAQNPQHASLTLLLPHEVATDDWRGGGDRAAARMLVSTLACELAPRALRVNALEVAPDVRAERLAPVLQFVTGARAQFLTGQTIRVR